MMKSLSLVVLWFLAYGCAAKKLAIKNADSLLQYQIAKRLPLNPSQERILTQDVTNFLNESKPKIEKLIPLIDVISLETPDPIQKQFEDIMIFVKSTSIDFSKIMAKHMANLSEKQQQEFFATLSKENKDLHAKSASKKRDEFEVRFETFFGPMNDAQIKLYEEYRPYFELRFLERIKRREKLHQSFKEIYAQAPPAEKKRELFLGSFANYQNAPFENEKSVEILHRLIPTLTQAQRDQLKKTIREFQELINYFIQTDY